jgi:hypothetical protein
MGERRLTSMTIHEVHHGTGANIGHVGLALIAEMTRVSGLDDLCRKSTKAKQDILSAVRPIYPAIAAMGSYQN